MPKSSSHNVGGWCLWMPSCQLPAVCTELVVGGIWDICCIETACWMIDCRHITCSVQQTTSCLLELTAQYSFIQSQWRWLCLFWLLLRCAMRSTGSVFIAWCISCMQYEMTLNFEWLITLLLVLLWYHQCHWQEGHPAHKAHKILCHLSPDVFCGTNGGWKMEAANAGLPGKWQLKWDLQW